MKPLYLVWQDPQDRRWYPVGRLTFDGQTYRFSYTRGANKSPRFIPFGRMRDLQTVYESTELFPLFANRLLSKGRPEYNDFLHWLNLPANEGNLLTMLARSGGLRETDSLMMFPCPERSDIGDYQMRFFAQGLRYLPEAAVRAASALSPGSRVFLMPDPQNEHDQLAIGLRTGDPKTLIGYCPRYLTDDFHFLLASGDSQNVKVIAEMVNPDAPIQLRVLCQLTAPWPKGFQPCSGEDYQPLPSALTTPQRAAS